MSYYNEMLVVFQRLLDKSKVTCTRWVPGSANLFLVAHASGQLYLYNESLQCGTSQPHYQVFKQGDGYSIHTCKTKVTRNPLYRWVIGAEGCSINELSFSPCGQHLAVVSQDGFLRVFHYDTMELIGVARSYFGGFLCVCWSPDGKYVVVGGEDDLVTVWSFLEKRVVARGQGHHSWVSVVAFDPFTTSLGHYGVTDTSCGSQDEFNHEYNKRISASSECSRLDSPICYRLGSVGQDTQLCLWDITEDVLRQPICPRTRPSIATGNGSAGGNNFLSRCNNSQANSIHNRDKENLQDGVTPPSFTQRLVGGLGGFGDRKESSGNHKRNMSRNSGCTLQVPHSSADDPMRLIGTSACPRFDDCPLLEPLICKKIAHERLTALVFREDCFVAACQDGYVYTWARPGKIASANTMSNCIDGKDL